MNLFAKIFGWRKAPQAGGRVSDSLQYLNNVAEIIADALIVVDSRGVIELANNSALKLLQYESRQLLGREFVSIISDKFSPQKEEFIRGRLQAWEGFWKTSQGGEIPVSCSSAMVKDKEARLIHVVYVARDISEFKRVEESLLDAYRNLKDTRQRLLQSEKMAVVGRLAGGIAHEIRNPLAIILQGIYLIDTMLPPSQDAREVVEMVRNAVNRANNIIARLLEYSRKSHLVTRSHDIRLVIDEGLSVIEDQARRKDISIEKIYPDNPVVVCADKLTLAQVFLNLATNSLETMSEGGQIKIKAYQQHDFCIIEFADNGPGIKEEELPKIFEPFYTTKAPSSGSGLGLAMAHLIVERHAGRISVVSRLNHGTKFTIQLPLAK